MAYAEEVLDQTRQVAIKFCQKLPKCDKRIRVIDSRHSVLPPGSRRRPIRVKRGHNNLIVLLTHAGALIEVTVRNTVPKGDLQRAAKKALGYATAS